MEIPGFEWDEAKRRSNIVKHGVDFLDVPAMLLARNRLDAVDNRRDYGEVRQVTLGPVRGRVLHVTWTWRGAQRRLISARLATPKERRRWMMTASS